MLNIKGIFTKYEIVIILSLIFIDQFIKIVIDKNLELFQIGYTNFLFSITKLYNSGISFSFLEGKTLFIIVVSLVAFYLLIKIKSEFSAIIPNFGIVLIISGALGNLLDRIFYGYVIDYIKLGFINFPIFNFADIVISLGFMIILFYELFNWIRRGKNERK